MLNTPIEKIGFLITLLRDFEVLIPSSHLNDSANPSDHAEVGVLEQSDENPAEAELEDFLSGLNMDEKIELVALLWLGRGDFAQDGWSDALEQASDEVETHNIAQFLLVPSASEFLEEGLTMLGYSIEEAEEDFNV